RNTDWDIAPQQQAAELLNADKVLTAEEEAHSPSSMDTDNSQSITSDSSSDSESMDTDDNQSEADRSKTPIPNGVQSTLTFAMDRTGIADDGLPNNRADKMDTDERSERTSDDESSDSSSSASGSSSSSRAASENRVEP